MAFPKHHDDSHLAAEDTPRSIFITEKETSKEIFISIQPQPFISRRQLFDANDDLYASESVKGKEDSL